MHSNALLQCLDECTLNAHSSNAELWMRSNEFVKRFKRFSEFVAFIQCNECLSARWTKVSNSVQMDSCSAWMSAFNFSWIEHSDCTFQVKFIECSISAECSQLKRRALNVFDTASNVPPFHRFIVRPGSLGALSNICERWNVWRGLFTALLKTFGTLELLFQNFWKTLENVFEKKVPKFTKF